MLNHTDVGKYDKELLNRDLGDEVMIAETYVEHKGAFIEMLSDFESI